MRRVTNLLQAASGHGEITRKKVLEVASKREQKEFRKLVDSALGGKFLEARKELNRLMLEQGVSGEEILLGIHKAVLDSDIGDLKKVEMVEKVGEADFRMVEGSNPSLQLEALLARLALLGGEK